MSTIVSFNNKNIVEPGVYSQIKSGINNQPQSFSTGNVVIIDTGEGEDFGGGSGVNGELYQGSKTIYSFSELSDFRSFVRGGLLWDLAEYLFNPVSSAPGAPQVSIVRAATTTKSIISYNFKNGLFKISTKNEGSCSNGVENNGNLIKGYASKLKKGIIDNDKYIIEFFEATFKGYDQDKDPFDNIKENEAKPILIARSQEFSNISELINWAKNSFSFQSRFSVEIDSFFNDNDEIDDDDYQNNLDLLLSAGGTTQYNLSDYDDVLSVLGEFDNTFFLSLKNDKDAKGIENTKLLYHINNESEFKKFLIIGGGNDSLGFDKENGSIDIAQYFDSPYVGVVHSAFYIDQYFSANKKFKSSLYHAALVCGRMAGLLPQTSITFKNIRAKDFVHQLSQKQRELAIQAGVIHNRYVPNIGYVINQGINTLQKNSQLVNSDGTSHEFTIMRIAEQLNKELVLNMRPIFVGQNINTASPADVKAFIEGYLTFKTATRTQDNLIIRFEKVNVKQIQDYYDVSYCFVPNGPLNKIFITGFILDSNLTA